MTRSSSEVQKPSSPALVEDNLILVDDDDNPVAEAGKLDCHLGDGKLHRAFSLHIIDSSGKILLQQRSQLKMLWPGYWTNSCCSHPRAGEEITAAVRRRAREELGLDVEAEYLYKFHYHASFESVGSENELCSVFVAYSDNQPDHDPDEIADWEYLDPKQIARRLEQEPGRYTPWFHLEWQRLCRDFRNYGFGD